MDDNLRADAIAYAGDCAEMIRQLDAAPAFIRNQPAAVRARELALESLRLTRGFLLLTDQGERDGGKG